jgi:ABC-type transport system involved in multi-copper enzyme maturation permease subunit
MTYLWYNQGLFGVAGNVWATYLNTASQVSVMMSQMTLVLLAGHVIACERRDRSAEFLAYLPPTRSAILRSKALLSVAAFVVVWGVFLCVAGLVVPTLDGDVELASSQAHSVTLALGVAMFGMAWFGSSMLESPTYATAIGVVAALVVPILLNCSMFFTGYPADGPSYLNWLRTSYFAVGVAGFVIGWLSYVRRVEP